MDGLVIRRERIRGLRRVNLDLGVEEILGSRAKLHRKQEEVLKRVIGEGIEKILVVIGIGKGKSLM
jgi:hypothetical protein